MIKKNCSFEFCFSELTGKWTLWNVNYKFTKCSVLQKCYFQKTDCTYFLLGLYHLIWRGNESFFWEKTSPIIQTFKKSSTSSGVKKRKKSLPPKASRKKMTHPEIQWGKGNFEGKFIPLVWLEKLHLMSKKLCPTPMYMPSWKSNGAPLICFDLCIGDVSLPIKVNSHLQYFQHYNMYSSIKLLQCEISILIFSYNLVLNQGSLGI